MSPPPAHGRECRSRQPSTCSDSGTRRTARSERAPARLRPASRPNWCAYAASPAATISSTAATDTAPALPASSASRATPRPPPPPSARDRGPGAAGDGVAAQPDDLRDGPDAIVARAPDDKANLSAVETGNLSLYCRVRLRPWSRCCRVARHRSAVVSCVGRRCCSRPPIACRTTTAGRWRSSGMHACPGVHRARAAARALAPQRRVDAAVPRTRRSTAERSAGVASARLRARLLRRDRAPGLRSPARPACARRLTRRPCRCGRARDSCRAGGVGGARVSKERGYESVTRRRRTDGTPSESTSTSVTV
jgi:hypothetical protein